MDQLEQAGVYYGSIDEAYHEWHRQMLIQDTGMSHGTFTSDNTLDEIRNRFNRWFVANKETLRKKICYDWRYNEKREKFVDGATIVTALASVLEGWVGAPLAVSAILVKQYLDQLCHDPPVAT